MEKKKKKKKEEYSDIAERGKPVMCFVWVMELSIIKYSYIDR